jgi:hypothetical protein
MLYLTASKMSSSMSRPPINVLEKTASGFGYDLQHVKVSPMIVADAPILRKFVL